MRWGLGLLAVAVCCLESVLPARCEDQQVLMLDTGGHQALITGIAFTPDGKYLVSAARDKVVRVWDWRAGKTVRTIRGRVASGLEGQIFAVALSPNGRWLAVAGFMASNGERVGEIRLYDFATDELKAVLRGHHNAVVEALAFSPDSKLLISGSGLGDMSAIIWDIEKRQPLHPPLKGHTAEISRVGFTPDGLRAVTASYDKTLRLWNVADGRLVNTMQGHSEKIQSLAISRKDGTIASGDISGDIRLWDGQTGVARRSAPFVHPGGVVGSVSFSPDGQLLLATCATLVCHDTQRVFDAASGKELKAYSKHDDTVVASAFSPDGQLVATAGGHGNEVYIWDPRSGDTKAVLKGAGRTDFAVAFSPDGRRFAWGSTNKSVGHNNLGPLEMTLRLPSADEPLGEPEPIGSQDGWVRAQDHFGSWSLQHRAGGNFGYADAVLDIIHDGKVQVSVSRPSWDGDDHHCYGFTPDGQSVISGGGAGSLNAYRRDGTKIGGFIGHESDVWAVAVSPDGKYLVSGSGDQTVRLWDMKSHELLVTLFYGTDGEWVMWTPEGFYTSSKKGAERVGWQINHGSDKAADYVTGAQVRDAFFRPDLVAAKIAGDPDGKVKAAAAELSIEEVLKSGLAPEVTIVSPAEGSKADDVSVTVTARVVDKGGGIGRIAWRINGQEIQLDYGASALDPQGEITRSFELAATDNKVEVVAENKSGKVASRAVGINVKVDKRVLDGKGLPDLYVLALGVDSYNDVKHKLEFAVSDARELSATLADAGNSYYRHPPQVVMLRDDQVNAAGITAAFKELGGKIKATDVFLFFIAGHGKMINGDYYFVPGNVAAFTEDAIAKDGFGPRQWRDWFVNIKAQKSVWIFDTCDAGAAVRIFRGNSAEEVAQQRMKAATGRVMFMASSDQQSANEGYHGHGVLTYALLEGLARAGDEKNKMINLTDLKDYVEIKVPQYSREMKACQVQRQQEYCQKPLVPLEADNYALVPRYPAILARLGTPTTGAVISQTPTHVVIAAADLMASATRGGEVKRQLPPGTLVTLVKTEGEWAYVAEEGVALGYVLQSRLVKMLNR